MHTLHLARPVNTMMQDCEYFCVLRKDYVDSYVAVRQKKNESAGVRKRYTHADLAAELKITRSYFSALYNGRPASGEFIPRAIAHFENGNAQYFPVVFDCKKIDRDVNDIKYSWDWKEQRRENAPRIGDTNG